MIALADKNTGSFVVGQVFLHHNAFGHTGLDILNQDIIGGKLIIPVLGNENFPPFSPDSGVGRGSPTATIRYTTHSSQT